ncbi:MAG: histidine kinase [Lachnospiraceae bacterium]|nr:histidine kinase [Lachnospiraceae bacterium]
MEQYIAQRETIERQAASIRVLQMRPHFIYNTMMSIYYLCKQDADKAQAVILDFNSYLRRNFTAIAKEGTIPFSEELEHTRAYLAVEQVRFEGKSISGSACALCVTEPCKLRPEQTAVPL